MERPGEGPASTGAPAGIPDTETDWTETGRETGSHPDHAGPGGGTHGHAGINEISDEPAEPYRSLLEDVEALVEDGKTYLTAEVNYQKTRGAVVAGNAKIVAICGASAAVLALIAAMALAVGLIIALAPYLSIWGSTALVVGALLLIAALLIGMAAKRAKGIAAAIKGAPEDMA